jgi:beta-glucosidase
VPIFYGHRPSGGRSHWKVDYVETSVKPLYPFGYGLSYTRFELDNFRVEPLSARAGDTVTIQVDVTNVGARSGDEVVQLYTHQEVPVVTRPVKELKGFQRVTLEPQQTRTVTFRIPVNQLGFYNLDQQFVVEPGAVDVMVGTSSQDIHCNGSFAIVGEKAAIAEKVFFSTNTVS